MHQTPATLVARTNRQYFRTDGPECATHGSSSLLPTVGVRSYCRACVLCGVEVRSRGSGISLPSHRDCRGMGAPRQLVGRGAGGNVMRWWLMGTLAGLELRRI